MVLLKQITKALEMFFLVCLLCSSPSDDMLVTDAKFPLSAVLFRAAASFILLTFAMRPVFLPFLNDAVSPGSVVWAENGESAKQHFIFFLKTPAKSKKKKNTEVLSNESEKHDSSLLSRCQKNVSTTELLPLLSVLLPAFIMNLTGLHNEAIIDSSLPARQWN